MKYFDFLFLCNIKSLRSVDVKPGWSCQCIWAVWLTCRPSVSCSEASMQPVSGWGRSRTTRWVLRSVWRTMRKNCVESRRRWSPSWTRLTCHQRWLLSCNTFTHAHLVLFVFLAFFPDLFLVGTVFTYKNLSRTIEACFLEICVSSGAVKIGLALFPGRRFIAEGNQIWRWFLYLLFTHADRQGVDMSVTVCLCVCVFCNFLWLRISPPKIKLVKAKWCYILHGGSFAFKAGRCYQH